VLNRYFEWVAQQAAAAESDNAQLRAVLEAARCIRHWHDRGEGMVVSAEYVRALCVGADRNTTPPMRPFGETPVSTAVSDLAKML
jgi:hypothetical protein